MAPARTKTPDPKPPSLKRDSAPDATREGVEEAVLADLETVRESGKVDVARL